MAHQKETYDFVKFYKSAAETFNQVEKRKSDDSGHLESSFSNISPKRHRSPYKNKKKSFINNTESSKDPEPSSLRETNLKSILKRDSVVKNSSPSTPDDTFSNNKPKKRNKSLSFVLNDTAEVAIKRSKSEDAVNKTSKDCKVFVTKTKNLKRAKKKQVKKENNSDPDTVMPEVTSSNAADTELINKTNTSFVLNDTEEVTIKRSKSEDAVNKKKTRKLKKAKKKQAEKENNFDPDTVVPEVTSSKAADIELINKTKKRIRRQHIKLTINGVHEVIPSMKKTENGDVKTKKRKNKERCIKTDVTDTSLIDEPMSKSVKHDVKPEAIALDLENLNIGDNAHTLTNLLDEMVVVDKHKKRKQKNTRPDIENLEKVKWCKRRWNKDKLGEVNQDKHLTSIIIENLPLNILLGYKKYLTEHFVKFGMIKQIGIAEVYPTENPKPVFSTTIQFDSEDAANKALEEDNALLEGARIRVKQPLAPIETTLVVKSFARLTDQALSSVFCAAGRISNIRHLIKGKKSMSTAFIEFDGPHSVERAIKMAEDAKIGGKNILASKFELRISNKKMKKNEPDDNDVDSDSSNE